MRAYIINMDDARRRWKFVRLNFQPTGLEFVRVSAVDGRQMELPIPEYDEPLYLRHQGRRTNKAEIGCYLSHIKCLRLFLESGDEFALIGEDDIRPVKNIAALLRAAIEHKETWDILRLSGYHRAHPLPITQLDETYSLCVTFTKLCGTGAYLVNRRAAEVLVDKLLPMHVPVDHALDREWCYGLKAASIMPLPISQNEECLGTQIACPDSSKLPWQRRLWTTFPYRLVNETSRLVFRTWQLLQARDAVRRKAARFPREIGMYAMPAVQSAART